VILVLPLLSHASVADARDRVISGVCDYMCVHVLKGKRLELSTWYTCLAVAQHVLTWRSKGQRTRTHGHETVTVASWLPAKFAAVAVCCCCRHGTAHRMTALVSSFNYFAPAKGAKYWDEYVHLTVCLLT